MTCVYQEKSDEAYSVHPRLGFEKPVDVALCSWPDMHPDRLINAPRWLLRKIGGGLTITPERDCVNCPARREERPATDGGDNG